MKKVPPHFAHQQHYDQSHYGQPYGQHYGVPVQYVHNQYHQYQMQPQHHVIRNPSPMQQAQQPPPQVQQQAAPSQTGVATQPVTVAAHQQPGQQQQSPQQQQHQQQQQQATQPSTPNNISNSQSPNQIQSTEIDGKFHLLTDYP